MTFTDNQQNILSIAGRCASTIATLSSGYIVWSVLSNSYYRSRTYHRLMLGFSVATMITSINFLWGSAAVPEGVSIKGANGTIATCSLQGFTTQVFVFTGLFYHTAIAIYSFAGIRNEFNTIKLQQMEPWLHLGVIMFPLASAIYLASVQGFNYTGGQTCWIESVPAGCGVKSEDSIECIRGPQNIGLLIWIFGGLPTILALLIPTVIMIALYVYVRVKQQQKQLQLDATIVASQAGLFLLAIYWSQIFIYADDAVTRIFGTRYFSLEVVSACQARLLGFYTMLAYLKLRHSPPIPDTDTNSEEAQPQQDVSPANWNGKVAQHQMSTAENGATRRHSRSSEFSFTIFDGAKPSDRWCEFIHQGDEKDETEDHYETEKWADVQSHV